MKLLQLCGLTALMLLFTISFSSAAVLPQANQTSSSIESHSPPIQKEQSSKRLYKLKRKLSKAKSQKRIAKLSANIDKIEKENSKKSFFITAGVLLGLGVVGIVLAILVSTAWLSVLLWILAVLAILLAGLFWLFAMLTKA